VHLRPPIEKRRSTVRGRCGRHVKLHNLSFIYVVSHYFGGHRRYVDNASIFAALEADDELRGLNWEDQIVKLGDGPLQLVQRSPAEDREPSQSLEVGSGTEEVKEEEEEAEDDYAEEDRGDEQEDETAELEEEATAQSVPDADDDNLNALDQYITTSALAEPTSLTKTTREKRRPMISGADSLDALPYKRAKIELSPDLSGSTPSTTTSRWRSNPATPLAAASEPKIAITTSSPISAFLNTFTNCEVECIQLGTKAGFAFESVGIETLKDLTLFNSDLFQAFLPSLPYLSPYLRALLLVHVGQWLDGPRTLSFSSNSVQPAAKPKLRNFLNSLHAGLGDELSILTFLRLLGIKKSQNLYNFHTKTWEGLQASEAWKDSEGTAVYLKFVLGRTVAHWIRQREEAAS